MIESRRCTKCRNIYPLTVEHWYRSSGKNHRGFGYLCRDCVKESWASPEVKAKHREYWRKPEVKARMQQADWIAKSRATKRKWNQSKKGRALRAAHAANEKASRYGASGILTTQDILNLWDKYPDCLVCGDDYGLDHIVPFSQGGSNTLDNLQNLCRSCNGSKRSQTIDYRKDYLG